MTAPFSLSWLDAGSATWPAEIDRLRALLGAPRNPSLFPAHYLKATLPKIGGAVVMIRQGDRLAGVGFLFPRQHANGRKVYTLRLHRLEGAALPDGAALTALVERDLGGGQVILYDPLALQQYEASGRSTDQTGLIIGRPSAEEAVAVRQGQQAIWQGDADTLYPVDLHAASFGAAQSLVARLSGQLAGFLFGFYAFSGPPLPASWRLRGDWRLESQVLGVLPAFRQHGIAAGLKAAQAQEARAAGIAVVHWTFDPLQFANAALNLGRLRAVAYSFYPEYYEFVNVLNRVPASRLGITWLVSSRRVREALATGAAEVRDLSGDQEIQRVNDGPDAAILDACAPRIAIEIPGNWTALQADAPQQALRWRRTTDQLFSRFLGCQAGQYIVTGVGVDGDRRYLMAEQVSDRLLEQLAH